MEKKICATIIFVGMLITGNAFFGAAYGAEPGPGGIFRDGFMYGRKIAPEPKQEAGKKEIMTFEEVVGAAADHVEEQEEKKAEEKAKEKEEKKTDTKKAPKTETPKPKPAPKPASNR